MTRIQNNNRWNGGIATKSAPNFRLQKSAGNVLASIFLAQDCILLIDYLPKGQNINAEYYLSLLVQLKDIFKEKHRGKFTKSLLFLHKMTRLTGHLQPRRNWLTLASNFLITLPIPWICSRRTTTCFMD